MDALKTVLEYGAEILQSQVATSLLLLGAFVLQTVYTRRAIARHRAELKAAFIECRRDAIKDAGFMQSLMGVTHSYKVLVMTVTSGNRQPPPELKQIDERFERLRHEVHDERNNRVARLNKTLDRLQEKAEKEPEE